LDVAGHVPSAIHFAGVPSGKLSLDRDCRCEAIADDSAADDRAKIINPWWIGTARSFSASWVRVTGDAEELRRGDVMAKGPHLSMRTASIEQNVIAGLLRKRKVKPCPPVSLSVGTVLDQYP
jgi:hypothetical protein